MERTDRRNGKSRTLKLTATAVLALSLGCAKQPPTTVQPAPAAPAMPVSVPTVLPPSVLTGAQTPSLSFLESLLGTLPLDQVAAPQALDDYTQARTWTSSALAGSSLLEAWSAPTSGGSHVDALEFDPASASYHVLGIDPSGAIDRSPSISGGPNGSSMVLWASQANSADDGSVVGQVFDSSGQGGARWNYRHGNGAVGDTALAGSTNGFVALWTQSESGGDVLLAQPITSTGGPLGNPTVVSSTGASASTPAIAAGSNGYLTVWSDSRNGGSRVYGELLSSSGQAQAAEFPISDGEGVRHPQVMWDGTQYWVSWYDGRAGLAGAYDAYVQPVNSSGGLVGSNVRVSDHRMEHVGVAPRVVPQGSSDLVVFAGQAVDDLDPSALAPSAVYGSVLTAGATPSTPFALTPLDSSGLVDAQDWGSKMVMLTLSATGSGQTSLDWSMYRIPGSSATDPFATLSGSSYSGASYNSLGYGSPSGSSTSYGSTGYGYQGSGTGYFDTLKPSNPYLP